MLNLNVKLLRFIITLTCCIGNILKNIHGKITEAGLSYLGDLCWWDI